MSRKKMIRIVIGAVIGGIFGFLYFRFVGCKTGACVITGNPYISTLYWAVLGGIVANIL
ncbi:MAG: YtxH domain-containing protein [Candidatus Aminicenantes bacterium]|nr:YtxH domain-containing protein [Candidatus Aminicenantes bacterium]